jgi:hypothetical protein
LNGDAFGEKDNAHEGLGYRACYFDAHEGLGYRACYFDAHEGLGYSLVF